MHFSTIILSTLAVVASASPLTPRQDTCPVVTTGDYIWKIDNLYIRKLDGKSVSTIGFDILATNGGTLNFTCTPYDKTTNQAVTTNIVDSTLYSCGENSFIDFAWQSDRNGLLLKQDVSDTIKYIGTTTLPNHCRAGGSNPNDFVCDGVSPAYITLVQNV